MPLYSQEFPYERFNTDIRKPHMTKLMTIVDEYEFRKTAADIVKHLPTSLIGNIWNLIQDHRKQWQAKKVVFPKKITTTAIADRYKYLEEEVISYKQTQKNYKKTKSFPFVFAARKPRKRSP